MSDQENTPPSDEQPLEDQTEGEVTEGEEEAVPPDMHWYVVHTYSGFEYKVKESLDQRIVTMGLEDQINKVLVPTEPSVENRRGKTTTVNKKFFPGYILVYMRLTDESWLLVKNTPKVTGFVGHGRTPPPLTEDEVMRIFQQVETGAVRQPRVTSEFKVGDKVKVNEGPFANFVGEVDEVTPERSKLKVMVSIFGRQTPIELEFDQVEAVA